MNQTAKIAERLDGKQLYQKRARQALPLLVRQANAGEAIFYSNLAQELNMPNPRNLNYPLGSIGRTLEALGEEWGEKIPPIQCLVINKNTGLPGEGIGWFLIKQEDFKSLSNSRKREIVKGELARVFSYPRWPEVLKALDVLYAPSNYSAQIAAATRAGAGESDQHQKLKEFVSQNPHVIGLKEDTVGKIEVAIASGDVLDVFFTRGTGWVAAEVKSSVSLSGDITRGLFQCVKYRAVMEAMQASIGCERNARAVLVLEGKLPIDLIPLRNILGVEVIESISPEVGVLRDFR